MTDENKENRIRDLTDKMEKERGYKSPAWAFLTENDVDFMEAYNNLFSSGLTDGKALPAKTRELIAIVLLAYRGLEDSVYKHCKRALRLGATKQELLEAMETSILPGGAPTLFVGLRALIRIEEDEQKTK